MAGRLSLFQESWAKITSDSFVHQSIMGYIIPLEETPYQESIPIQKWSSLEMTNLNNEIQRLKELGAIQNCVSCNDQFISSYFLITKPNGKSRFILNLKKFNKYVKTDHFKLEDLRSVCKLLSQGSFMGTIDLKDAYFLVPIHADSRKYLRFIFDNQLYEFKCLPFGLATSPFVFTKIMKPVVGYLRSRGLVSNIYLDDLLCLGESYESCLENIETSCKVFESLGFVINWEKSSQKPSRSCKYLGFIISTDRMVISLPDEKKVKIRSLLDKFETKSHCKISEFAQLIGSLVSSSPGVEYGLLHCKSLESVKVKALRRASMNFELRMVIPDSVRPDLQWWAGSINRAERAIRQFNFEREIFSNASLTGWGAAWDGNGAYGGWNREESLLDINHLELKAALLALKHFAEDLSDCEILLRVDNTTAIAYINREGGVKVDSLHELARNLWDWCEQRNMWVFAEYIASKDNEDADYLSRIKNSDTEWELAPYAFQQILREFGEPNIDLFASRVNTKCKLYCTWGRDPEALASNAFTIRWSALRFYAFPPFAIIPKVLQKIANDKASGTLVVPLWRSQPWFQIFQNLSQGEWIIFEPNPCLLVCSSSQQSPHQLAEKLTLVAANVSARRSREETLQRKPLRF